VSVLLTGGVACGVAGVISGWILRSDPQEFWRLSLCATVLGTLASGTAVRMTMGLSRESGSAASRNVSPVFLGTNLLLCGVSATAVALLVGVVVLLACSRGPSRGAWGLAACSNLLFAGVSGWVCLCTARRIRDRLSGR
jgi:hypothetical protein